MDNFDNRQLSDLPKIDDLHYTPLQKAYRTHSMVVTTIWLLLLLIMIFSLYSLEWMGVQYVLLPLTLVWCLLTCIALWSTERAFAVAGYAIRQHDVIYRQGFIWQTVTAVPYSRIQHTEVSQGPIGRLYHLYELEVYTAGGSSSDLHIKGLDRATAESIRAFIIRQADITDA